MTTDAGSGAAVPNDDMVELQRQLVALGVKMEASLDDAPNGEAVRAVDAQLRALNIRITEVGRRLLARQAVEISEAADGVALVIPEIETALGDLARLDAFVTGMTSVLALADKAIALAGKAAG